MSTELSEQEILRRQATEEMRKLGINPYPAPLYEVNAKTTEILEKYPQDNSLFQEVSIAGRIMSRRIMGAASFAVIQDSVGKIQLYIKRDEICPEEDKTMYNTVFKKLLDIGDIIGVKGYVFVTQMGETSIHVKELTVLSKSIRPLPIVKEKDGVVYDAFTNPEQRYRQRYLDLIVNPEVRDVFIKRTKIINTIRDFFNEKGYLEVETPVLQNIPGGAAARPFITHHNALDIPLYLRIANELYLKRLIVGGFEGVYEFSRNFRNEGMDRTHNPEFTAMEVYVAFKDYFWMMDFTEEMIERVAIAINGGTKVALGDKEIDFKRPYRRVKMSEAILEHTGYDITKMSEEDLFEACKKMNIEVDSTMGKGKLIDEIFGEKCEHHYVQPTFIYDYPKEMSPLTKEHRENKDLTERFELFINGKELANAYSELNDPIDQLDRFQQQLQLMERGDDEAMFIDYDFVRALEYGMPPTSGMGIGIDRLTMFMTNTPSIQDVLFFPQMKPEKQIEG
ncbi:MAG TPA: lysine--tRNA ligase [Bacteroidales bacterium]|nr:lysine--tRNA ligase [Bacteroidales bacterium]